MHKKLHHFIHRKDGTLKRGALSRVAEYLGVSGGTVKLWASGEWKPAAATNERILGMIADSIELSAKKTGPRPKKEKGDLRR
jgi:DNA-binding transcriptional regulator YiaG